LPHAQEAVKLDPKSPRYQDTLTATYNYLGRHREALLHAQEAVKLDPKNPTHQKLLDDISSFLGKDGVAQYSKDSWSIFFPLGVVGGAAAIAALIKRWCRPGIPKVAPPMPLAIQRNPVVSASPRTNPTIKPMKTEAQLLQARQEAAATATAVIAGLKAEAIPEALWPELETSVRTFQQKNPTAFDTKETQQAFIKDVLAAINSDTPPDRTGPLPGLLHEAKRLNWLQTE
jgi:hypothetical protein